MSSSPSSSTTAVASNSSPEQEGGVSSAVGNGGGPDIANLCNRYAIVASSAPAPRCSLAQREARTLESLRGGQLPFKASMFFSCSATRLAQRASRSAYFCALAFSSGSGGGVPSPYAARASASSFSSVASSSVRTLLRRMSRPFCVPASTFGNPAGVGVLRRRSDCARHVEISDVPVARRALVHAAFDQCRLGRAAGVARAIGQCGLRGRDERCERATEADGGEACEHSGGRAPGHRRSVAKTRGGPPRRPRPTGLVRLQAL